MKKKKLKPADVERIKLMKKVTRVMERKAKALGIDHAQYFMGIAQGKYPKITPEEAAAEPDA